MNKEERLELLHEVFSPSAPIKKKDFFYGRMHQLKKVVDSINESGEHAILYGERGVGKTSLANIMSDIFTNTYPVKVTCNRDDDFKSLWSRAFRDVQYSQTTKGLGFNAEDKKNVINIGDEIKKEENLSPSSVEQYIKRLNGNRFLIIFDEFDNIRTKKMRILFADLIKALSDNVDNTTIVLVGIADNVESLIGSHQSLERCLKQVKMPRMSDAEASDIIVNGLGKLGISIMPQVKSDILEFSSGFPHYIHLLCKYGAKELIENNKSEFNEAYLKIAIKNGIENTGEQLRFSYQKATLDAKTVSKWVNILHACANSKSDVFNCFTIKEVVFEYNKITKKFVKGHNINYNLNQFCSKDRGEVLTKMGKGSNTKFRFINPMMRAFVKLKINGS